MMASLYGMVVDVERPVYDFHWLCRMMKERKRVSLVSLRGEPTQGLINRIEPEDGSGHNWLVTLYDEGSKTVVFVRSS